MVVQNAEFEKSYPLQTGEETKGKEEDPEGTISLKILDLVHFY